MCNVILRRVRVTTVSMEAVNIAYTECVCSLSSKQCACAILMFCLVVPYFSTLSYKRHDSDVGGFIENKMCFVFL
jgi:hypothetical protein